MIMVSRESAINTILKNTIRIIPPKNIIAKLTNTASYTGYVLAPFFSSFPSTSINSAQRNILTINGIRTNNG